MNPLRWLRKEMALRAADRRSRKGNTEAALEYIEKARVVAPQSVDVVIQYCWALADLHRHEEAMQEVGAALKRFPQNGVLHMLQGEIFFAQKKYEEAKASLHKALELSGENLRIEYSLGRTYLALQDFDRASQFFESSVRYDKSLVQSRMLAMAEHYLLHNQGS